MIFAVFSETVVAFVNHLTVINWSAHWIILNMLLTNILTGYQS
jgi:hypothetical protein